ncbi:uncharacterized protein LOC112344852 [Selaginella moellendorffii]|uniref:uncharacterized protein LOC112344852 n=1 Tax=Selaginella moellendorffii TaxID=88036 RepID=UPI000D1D056D|nr:uncharacterized protein LOC112344852 [Selaginella moellendorffii]|eukprot:XP_024526127.1 uncharacterized protein LOC112344852 [Selaginella moellendorffii]
MELSLVTLAPFPGSRTTRSKCRRRRALVSNAIKSPPPLVVQLSVGVFALGFLDAGYSGDWSRIGVLSKGSEAVIRDAAFAVVPLCLAIILWIGKTNEKP